MNNNAKYDVTILVNSCDLFSDAWEPFFKLLKIQWPECVNYNIVLNSETKKYNCDFLNVRTHLYKKNCKWSKRLIKTLKSIKTEYILFFLEDFFLQESVDNDTFIKTVKFMSDDKSIGFIGLKYAPYRKYKDGSFVQDVDYVEKDKLIPTYNRVNSMTSLWRKDYLQKLLDKQDTVWGFEHNASIRSRDYSEKVMMINHTNNRNRPLFVYDVDPDLGYGIAAGRWLDKNESLFFKYGITNVNFDNLGIADKQFIIDYISGKIKRSNTEQTIEPKGKIIEFLYEIKKKFS